MRGHITGLGVATALLLGVYACSSSDGGGASDTEEEGGIIAVGEAGTNDDASSSGGSTDGSANDGSGDGALDASTLDATDAADAAPAVPEVVFVGRFDTSPALGPKVAYPSSEIIARFNGTEVKATFDDSILFTDYGKSRWQVIVDAQSSIISLERAPTTYLLATALAPGPHTVRLIKLTEPQVGTSQFLGFDFSGGVLLAPPPRPTRHFEFLGDSASNGFGIEGVYPCSFSSTTENSEKAYPALVAKDLGGDQQNLSVSGKGLYQNNYRPDLDVYSLVYPRIIPFTDGSMWDFTKYTPDVVWMTLGGNDYDDPDGNNMNAPDAPPFASFQAKYDEMVTLVRTKHPSAHIFCAVAPSLNDGYPAGYNAFTNVKTAASNVVTAKNGAGDAKVHYFEFTRSQGNDLTGCDGHPNVTKHRAMADEAIAFIKLKMMWP
jgi:lysophospholipase L1-like esterase